MNFIFQFFLYKNKYFYIKFHILGISKYFYELVYVP